MSKSVPPTSSKTSARDDHALTRQPPNWRIPVKDKPLLQSAREFVAKYWSDVRDRAESRNELAYMSSHDIELLANDCGLTPGQFTTMMKRGPHAADELAELMKALGIDEAKLKAVSRSNFNDMKLICAGCGRKSECRRSLRKGTAAQDYGNFCDNAELLFEAKTKALATAA